MPNEILEDLLSYGPDNHAMEMILRLQSVTRWHLISTVRPQSVAEHSANVALLAMYIAETAPVFYFDPGPVVAAAALVHDIAESLMGDIPTHVKKLLPGVKVIEKAVTPAVFNIPVSPATEALIKLCDLADAVHYICKYSTDATGDRAYSTLHQSMTSKLTGYAIEYGWPEHLIQHLSAKLEEYCFECGV